MKRIKDIISAAKTLGLDPVALLKDCISNFDEMTHGDMTNDMTEANTVRVRLMRQIMDAVLDIAEDEAEKDKAPKPAKSEGEVAK